MSSQSEPLMEELFNCLSQQISELDLLNSMYPKHGEITIAESGVVDDINKFINRDSECVPNNLEFNINLIIDKLKLEICVNLPVTYPNDEPDINVRCNQLNRHQESNMNSELKEYIKSNHIGEVCLYTAITWLQENILITITKNQSIQPATNIETDKTKCNVERYTRYWIYSHHIYSKKKREEITNKSKELELTGFCLPGKPGVICIEGNENTCKEWWQYIKSLSWKKIVIRKTETFESNEKSTYRRFSNFVEIHFHASGDTKHANMSEFSKYMSKNGLGYIFTEFFGFHNNN